MGQCFLYGNVGSSGLRVVSGLTEPGNPKENMVWVKSDKAGRKYVFAAAEPGSPAEGLIWFRATAAGIITRADVYTGGAWAKTDAYMYLGGEWVQIASGGNGILITDGVPYTTPSTTGKVVQHDGYLQFGSGANKSTAMWFDDVDLTGYNTITLTGKFQHYSGQNYALFVLAVWYGAVDPAYGNAAAEVTYATKTTVTLDVSNLTGKHKVGLTSNNTYTQKITSLVLT